MSEKITAEHLRRKAMVYVRQSTQDQVKHNLESQRRQYALADRAKQLGWREVEVIDEDLGRSGASSSERTGFIRLVAEVSMMRVGAVFSVESSRLARNNKDWYQLVDLCSLTATLVVDHDGVYDPRILNDRLLLGLKGTMSEFELGLIRQRSSEALKAMVMRGELYTTLPVGYLRTPDNRCEKHPDRRVQYVISLVFQKFTECGSARQVLLWFRQQKVQLPSASQKNGVVSISWRLPVYNTVLKMLQNPIYAGAYAWGRTGFNTRFADGRLVKTAGHRKPRQEWLVLIQNHHDGYISWDEYEMNQKQIAENATMKGALTRGPARAGKSLLAGLLRCRRCGRKLHVSYSGTHSDVPRYSCRGAAINHGEGKCISFGGLAIDRAIEQEVLRVLQPGAIEASLKALEELQGTEDAKASSLALALEQARYEAERAFRQYDAVEPENRLVAAELERRWNQALAEVSRLESEAGSAPSKTRRLTPEQTSLLLSLPENLAAVWSAGSTGMALKKRLVKTVIEEIEVDVDQESAHIDAVIRWAGGHHTALRIRKNRTGQHNHRTDCHVVDVVRELTTMSKDHDIARVLNRLGFKTGMGIPWTESRVRSLRNYNGIPVFSGNCTSRIDMKGAARHLGVSPMSVRRLLQEGVIRGSQPVPYAPWAIEVTELQRAEVVEAALAIRSGKKPPLPGDPSQGKLNLAGTL